MQTAERKRHRNSLSTRGQRGETWRTKRWTAARLVEVSKVIPSKFWADCDLSTGQTFRRNVRALQAHIQSNPADACASAALARLAA